MCLQGVVDPLSEGEVGLHGCVVDVGFNPARSREGEFIALVSSLCYRSPAPFIVTILYMFYF